MEAQHRSRPVARARSESGDSVVLDGVSKVFPDGTVAVKDFSLAVRDGEFVAFLGPSGCGKTTTLKMIGGFEETTSGTITIAGRNVVGVPPERRTTGMVFQSYALFPHMNVTGNVEYGLKLRAMSKEERRRRVDRMLSLMDLADVAKRRIDQLSGGQRQRIAVARSVIVEPDVLLLDEPLGALDANLRVRMQAELKRIQKQLGITFIFVTHAQSEAMAMADRIVVINMGRIEQIGTPAEIFSQPASRFTAQFVGNNNLIDGTLQRENGRLLLSSPLGRFAAPPVRLDGTAPPAGGGNASLVVRADQVRFAADDLGGEYDSSVAGVLVGEDIVGSVINYLVQVGTDERLFHVEQHESLVEWAPELNDRVTLRWRSKDALLLAA